MRHLIRSCAWSCCIGLAAGASGACFSGDDQCGPGLAPLDGLYIGGSGFETRYTNLVAGANNDCPDPAAPAGVVSLTIVGRQLRDPTGFVTLCVSRPDLLGEPTPLGTGVQIIGLSATLANCTVTYQSGRVAGNAQATGLCGNGTDDGGFALTVRGTVDVRRNCLGTQDTIQLAIEGTTAVAKEN